MSSVGHLARAAQYRMPRALYSMLERARWAGGGDPGLDIPTHEELDPRAPIRLLVGPANYAGQGDQWARAAARELSGVSACTWTFTSASAFSYPSDVLQSLAVNRQSRHWQRRVFASVCERFTHVLLESGRPLFGSLWGFDTLREARALQAAGVSVAMAWHGTDIRDPSLERRTNPESPFRDADKRTLIAAYEGRAWRNHRIAAAADVPQFYSTPDLGAHVPGGAWLPVTVDEARWMAIPARDERCGPLRILFLPSNPWIKGASQVTPILDELAASGVIELVAEGRVEPDEVPALVAEADIVLDQFRLNLVGVASAEAMLAGRAVVALAGPPLRDAVVRLTGEELPVLSASPAELAHTLSTVTNATLEDLRKRGHTYARKWHTGRAAAEALAPWLGI